MAYKSPVTQYKWFQSQAPAVGRLQKTTEGDQVVKALESISPVLANVGAAYISDKQQKAVTQLRELKTQLGADFSEEKVNELIKSGQAPELESMYSQAVKDRFYAKVDAADDIAKVVQRWDQYDGTQDFDDFFNSSLRDSSEIEGKGQGYRNSYYAAIEEVKSKYAIKAAELQAERITEKINSDIVKVYKNYDVETANEILNQGIANDIYSPTQVTTGLMSIGTAALSSMDIDEVGKAIELLETPRNLAKGVGRLADTKDGMALSVKLNTRLEQLINAQNSESYMELQSNINSSISSALQSADPDGSLSFLQIAGLPKGKLQANENNGGAELEDIKRFQLDIMRGDVDSEQELLHTGARYGLTTTQIKTYGLEMFNGMKENNFVSVANRSDFDVITSIDYISGVIPRGETAADQMEHMNAVMAESNEIIYRIGKAQVEGKTTEEIINSVKTYLETKYSVKPQETVPEPVTEITSQEDLDTRLNRLFTKSSTDPATIEDVFGGGVTRDEVYRPDLTSGVTEMFSAPDEATFLLNDEYIPKIADYLIREYGEELTGAGNVLDSLQNYFGLTDEQQGKMYQLYLQNLQQGGN